MHHCHETNNTIEVEDNKIKTMAPIYTSLPTRPTMLSLASVGLVALLSLLPTSEARRWEDVISVSIYAQSHIDVPRIQYSLEADPFSNMPAPSIYQSELLSDAPSSVPSYFADPNESLAAQSGSNNKASSTETFVGQNCPDGEYSYKINKIDTWGDGWGETFLVIREVNSNLDVVQSTSPPGETTFTISKDIQVEDYEIAAGSANRTDQNVNGTSSNGGNSRKLESVYQGGLQDGGFEAEHVCLSHTACYEVTLQGGKWQEEAKWEIVPIGSSASTTSGSAVAKGQGFSNCTFYVSDSVVDHPSCPFTCKASSGGTSDSEGVPVAQAAPPVQQQKSAIALQTDVPTGAPSDMPSLVPTMIM